MVAAAVVVVAVVAHVAAAEAVNVVVFDGGAGKRAVSDVADRVAEDGDRVIVADADEVDAFASVDGGCVSDDCAVEFAAAHGAAFVVVVGTGGWRKIDVASGAVVLHQAASPPTPTPPNTRAPATPATTNPPKTRAATRPPTDDRAVSAVGTAVIVGGGVGAAVGVVVLGVGALTLVQPGASEQHTTGLALVGGGGLVAVAGCVAIGVGEGLRE